MIIVSLLEDNQNWLLSKRKPSSWKPCHSLEHPSFKIHAKSQIYGHKNSPVFKWNCSNSTYRSEPTKTSVKHHVPGNSAGDLFWDSETWPFSMVKWPPNVWGWKGHFDSKVCKLETEIAGSLPFIGPGRSTALAALQALPQLVGRFKGPEVDISRCIVAGHSMGGHGAWYLGFVVQKLGMEIWWKRGGRGSWSWQVFCLSLIGN